MDRTGFTTAATAGFARFGSAAHKAIDLYRDGGERLAQFAHDRWDAAFEQASPKLDAQTRKNALHARDVFSRYYARGLAVSADGAGIAVDTLVGAAIAGIEKAATFKQA